MAGLPHEPLATSHVQPGSPRNFGLVMAAAFACLAILNWWHDGRIWPWLAATALTFLVIALAYPRLLGPLNRLWFRFGLLLHAVVNPVIMALLFYGAVFPTGFVMRLLGRDLIRLKRDPNADSYWIARTPPGPLPESLKDQF